MGRLSEEESMTNKGLEFLGGLGGDLGVIYLTIVRASNLRWASALK